MDKFETGRISEEYCLVLENLYHVFVNIKNNDGEYIQTLVDYQAIDAQITFKNPYSIKVEIMFAFGEAAEVLGAK